MKRWLLAVLLLAMAAGASASTADERCAARVDLTGLPLVELAATSRKAADVFAVMLSGDGGWRRIKITDKLRGEGVPVVGFLTPDYFRQRRGADESACALERVIRAYQLRFHREKVVLIGYSRGADILPFMASRLPADVHASVELIALLGLEPTIDFRYHPSWIPFYHPKEHQYPVAPEVDKLRDLRVLCIYGEQEKDSLCRSLDPAHVTIVREHGSHHFAGNYKGIAETILSVR